MFLQQGASKKIVKSTSEVLKCNSKMSPNLYLLRTKYVYFIKINIHINIYNFYNYFAILFCALL